MMFGRMINVDSGYWFVLTLFGIDGALAQKAWELSYADLPYHHLMTA